MMTMTILYETDIISHIPLISMASVRLLLSNRIISTNGDHSMTSQIPDLLDHDRTACNVFFSGQFKSKVYRRRHATMEELKTQLRQTIREIPVEM